MTCAFLKNNAQGLFNIGSGTSSTWNELAHAVFKAAGQEDQIEYIEMPPDLIRKYQNFSQANMAKTTQALKGEAACMSLEDAVEDYVHHYLIPERTW